MVADPFFCIKSSRLKETVHKVICTSINVKISSPDPADFAMTQLLICQLCPFSQWLGRPLVYRGCHIAICQGTLPDMPQLADFGGFYYDPASNLLAYHGVTAAICQQSPTMARSANTHQWIRCQVIAKSARIWRTCFT
jgi:hypothetical protein